MVSSGVPSGEIEKKCVHSRGKIGRTGLLKVVCEERGVKGPRSLTWVAG